MKNAARLTAIPTQHCRKFGYEPNDRWANLPAGWSWTEVAAVATDSRDRVYVFDRDGSLLTSWGEGVFARPHGITIGPDDSVDCTDDLDHTIRKITPDGRLPMGSDPKKR